MFGDPNFERRADVLIELDVDPVNPQDLQWFLEHHLDWFLEYRTREELLAMGEAAVPGGEAKIIDEPTGVNPFLVIRRI